MAGSTCPDRAPARPSTWLRSGSDKVALPDADAVLPQDGVCGGQVKVEVRQGKLEKVSLPAERHVLSADPQDNGPLFRAVDLIRVDALHEIPHPGQPLLQFVEARLGVFEFRL